jgi:DNA-binding NtrC family response regulator
LDAEPAAIYNSIEQERGTAGTRASRGHNEGRCMTPDARLLRGFVVLVVDDDGDNLAASAAVIESFGCGVLGAKSSDEALAILDSGTHVDLLFSDVVMPGTSGIALASLVRERRPTMPIVLATGYPDAVDAVTESGALALIKPYSIPRLEGVFAEQLLVGGRAG